MPPAPLPAPCRCALFWMCKALDALRLRALPADLPERTAAGAFLRCSSPAGPTSFSGGQSAAVMLGRRLYTRRALLIPAKPQHLAQKALSHEPLPPQSWFAISALNGRQCTARMSGLRACADRMRRQRA